MTKQDFYKAQDILQTVTKYKRVLSDVAEANAIAFDGKYNAYVYGLAKDEDEIVDTIKAAITDACNKRIEELMNELDKI